MKTQQDKLIKRFEDLSLKFHKLSLLFNELGKSINLELKKKRINPNSKKEIKDYLKTLDLDFDKIASLTIPDISLKELKGGKKE